MAVISNPLYNSSTCQHTNIDIGVARIYSEMYISSSTKMTTFLVVDLKTQ